MRLRVAGWSRSRHAFERDGSLFMEIARFDCRNCLTCAGRVETVKSALVQAGVEGSWHHAGGGYYLSVPYDGPVEPASFLRGLLGLPIAHA